MKITSSILAAAAMAAFSTGAYAATPFASSHLTYYWNFDDSTSQATLTSYTSPNGNGTGGVTNEGTFTVVPGAGLIGAGGTDTAAKSGAGTGAGDFYMTAVTGLDYSSFTVSLHLQTVQTTNFRDYFSIGDSGSSLFYPETVPAGGPSGSGLSLFWSAPLGGATPTNNTPGVQGVTSTLNDGAWHQIGFTSDGTTLSLYIDGTLKGTAAYTGSGAMTVLQAFSRFGAGVRHIDNTAEDDISLWNTALTGSQMALLSTTVAPDIAAVPEPSTVVLAAIFGIGMLFLFRRRRIA